MVEPKTSRRSPFASSRNTTYGSYSRSMLPDAVGWEHCHCHLLPSSEPCVPVRRELALLECPVFCISADIHRRFAWPLQSSGSGCNPEISLLVFGCSEMLLAVRAFTRWKTHRYRAIANAHHAKQHLQNMRELSPTNQCKKKIVTT